MPAGCVAPDSMVHYVRAREVSHAVDAVALHHTVNMPNAQVACLPVLSFGDALVTLRPAYPSSAVQLRAVCISSRVAEISPKVPCSAMSTLPSPDKPIA